MKVYVVFGGMYSDWYMEGYFTDEEEARKYCAVNGLYYIESELLDKKRDLSKIDIEYVQEVVFDLSLDRMRKEPNRYTFGLTGELKGDIIKYYPELKDKGWVMFGIKQKELNRDKAEKIAQDYYAILKQYMVENNNDIDKSIELLSLTTGYEIKIVK